MSRIKRRETALRYLKESPGSGDLHIWSDELLRDRELCLMAVEKRGSNLRYVPGELRDAEICTVAVNNYGMAISDVPEHLIDMTLCKIAIASNALAVRDIPKRFQTRHIRDFALEHMKMQRYVKEKQGWDSETLDFFDDFVLLALHTHVFI